MVDTIQRTTGARETSRLISSEKVTDTAVENFKGDSLGAIEDIMIDKISGRVAYAILKYGSFLGMGGKMFALPWDVLKYNTDRDAYVVDIPEARLKNAPSFDEGAEPNWGDAKYAKEIHEYYGSDADWYHSGL